MAPASVGPDGGPPAGADQSLPSAEVSRSELREATFSSLRWVTVARIAAELLSLAAGIFLAHLVPPADFGRVAVAVVVSELALALANQGTGSALVQRKTLDRAHVQSAAMLALIVGTTLMLATFFLAPLVTTPLFGEPTTELFRLLAPAFVIAAVGIVPLAMLERQLDFRRISMIEIVGVLTGALTSVGLALAGLNAQAYVIGALAGMVAWAGLLVVLGPSVMPRWRPRQMREIAGFGLPAGAASMAMVGYGNIDYLILGAKLSPAQVGFTTAPIRWGSSTRPRSATSSPNRVPDLLADGGPRPHASPALAGDPDQRGGDLPAAGAVHRHRPAAGALGLRPTVGPGRGAAQILTVAGMARMINNGTPSLVLAAGKPRTLLGFNLYRLATLAVVVFIAAPYGLNVVCVAVAAFQVITLIGSHRFMLARLAGLTVGDLVRDIGPATLASAIMLAAAYPLARGLAAQGLSSPVTIMIVAIVAAPLYLLTLRLLSPAAWADLLLLARRVLPRFGRRKAPPLPLDGSPAPSAQSLRLGLQRPDFESSERHRALSETRSTRDLTQSHAPTEASGDRSIASSVDHQPQQALGLKPGEFVRVRPASQIFSHPRRHREPRRDSVHAGDATALRAQLPSRAALRQDLRGRRRRASYA